MAYFPSSNITPTTPAASYSSNSKSNNLKIFPSPLIINQPKPNNHQPTLTMRLSLTILSLFLAVTLIAGKPAKPTASSNRVDPAPGATPQLSLVCSYPAVLSTCQKDCDCTGLEEDSTQPDCGTTVCTHNCQCLCKLSFSLGDGGGNGNV
jgi:hypothetical protein